MDNPSAAAFLDPRRMYTQIPSALATPPQSPSDDSWPANQAAEMPLVKDLLARNEQLEVPPGFVLCIPCYLCKQPFNDIETFKEHLTQHAAEIHAWHTAQVQASQEPPVQPPTQPMYQQFHPWPLEFPQQQPPPMASIPGPGPCPIHPPLTFPMAPSKPIIMDQPPMQFPMQLHQQMPVQPPLEFPGQCPVHRKQPMEFPIHQSLYRSVPLTPQSPLERMEQQFGYQKVQPIPPPLQMPLPHFTDQQPAPPPVQHPHMPHFMEQQPAPPPVELPHKPHFMDQQPAPPPVQHPHMPHFMEQQPTPPRLQLPHKPHFMEQPAPPRLQLPHKPHFMEERPTPPRVELPHKPHFMQEEPTPPPVELQRIVLQKPKEPIDRHMPKEQPPQLADENLTDQFSIEKHLHLPPSMELQRIVLQKPQQPVQSPIEATESRFPAEKSQSPSPEEQQLANQRLISISPEKELPQKASTSRYVRQSGRFQCDWCGKRLSSRQSVRYHQSRFHLIDDPPAYKVGKKVQKHFKCTTCKKRYKRRTFLLMHMKIKHGICASGAADTTVSPAIVESPVKEAPPPLSPERLSPERLPSERLSPERPSSPTSSEGTRREVWSTKVFNAVAAANYNPATEPAAKYVNPPRQQFEVPESGFASKPKRVYPMRSPFFNPDLWLDYDAYF